MPRSLRSFVIGLAAVSTAGVFALLPALAQAFPANGGMEVSDGMAPPGGAEQTMTDPIPANATAGSVGVAPLSGDDLMAFRDLTATIVEGFPWTAKLSTRAQATLGCVFLSYVPLWIRPPEFDEGFTFADLERQANVLNVCLQMAQALPRMAADQAQPANARCSRLDLAVTLKIVRTRHGFNGVVVGKLRNASNTSLSVSCRRSGHGLMVSLAPRARGQSLAHAGGPSIAIAYRNPTNKRLGIRTTFTAN